MFKMAVWKRNLNLFSLTCSLINMCQIVFPFYNNIFLDNLYIFSRFTLVEYESIVSILPFNVNTQR